MRSREGSSKMGRSMLRRSTDLLSENTGSVRIIDNGRVQNPQTPLAKKKLYRLHKIDNMARENSPFKGQMDMSSTTLLEDRGGMISAYTLDKGRSARDMQGRLTSAQAYTAQTEQRPSSQHRVYMHYGNDRKYTQMVRGREYNDRLVGVIRQQKRYQSNAVDRMSRDRSSLSSSYISQSSALKQSDDNYSWRRKSEYLDKGIRGEKEQIILLRMERDEMMRLATAEIDRVKRIDSENKDMHKRILDKEKEKRLLENTLRELDKELKRLDIKIEDMVITEKKYYRVISRYIEEDNKSNS